MNDDNKYVSFFGLRTVVQLIFNFSTDDIEIYDNYIIYSIFKNLKRIFLEKFGFIKDVS